MPFGQDKGNMMVNVPAETLLWYWKQDWIDQWPAVANYIEDHFDLLIDEIEKQGKTYEEI